LAFTRNPSDTSVSPATYTADGASDIVIIDQQRDISIDGSDEKDLIGISSNALAAQALYNYNVRGFAGNDTIDIATNLLQNSVINGNIGDDNMVLAVLSLNGSYFLGGKGSDDIDVLGVSEGEINGNIGNDNILVNTLDRGFNMYVGGGQGNDVVEIFGDFTNSIIDGNKGKDTIEILSGDHSGTSVNGGEGDDIVRARNFNGLADRTKGVVINGDLGNDTLVSTAGLGTTVTGGEGSDTIVSFAAAGESTLLDGGVGADFIGVIASGASETIVFDTGDSVAATATSFTGAVGVNNILGTNSTITFGTRINGGVGVDVLKGVGITTDKIDIDFKPKNSAGEGVIDVTGANLTTNLTAGKIYEVYGRFNDTTQVFTVEELAANQTASIYIVGGENLTLGQVFVNSTNMFVTDEDLNLAAFV